MNFALEGDDESPHCHVEDDRVLRTRHQDQ